MISFNNLGKMGRLGNQMFQYASLKGIARHHGLDFAIPFSPELDDWQDHQLSKYFKLDDSLRVDSVAGQNERWESHFHFDQTLFETCEDGTDLMGYFQTEKYFLDIREEILLDFSFKNDLMETNSCDYTVIHVRRGDYVGQSHFHPTCSLDYYRQAMEITGGPFLVVSDDIEWCKKNIPADAYSCSNNVQDLYAMSQAKNNIIANSSFSWWGAWLNQNPDKIVVSPERWFGDAYSHYNMEDIRPTEWIRL